MNGIFHSLGEFLESFFGFGELFACFFELFLGLFGKLFLFDVFAIGVHLLFGLSDVFGCILGCFTNIRFLGAEFLSDQGLGGTGNF